MAKDAHINVRVNKTKKSRAIKILKNINESMTRMVEKMLDEIYYTGGNPFEKERDK